MISIAELQKVMHRIAVEHGWWDGTTRENCPIPEKIALMHSELSEALEEFRNHNDHFYFVDGKPEGIAVELADCIIRILDLSGFMGWDIDKILREKMAYNETRPYRHGNKRI